jgi:hypothetical protein
MSKLLVAYTELNEARKEIRDLQVQLLVSEHHIKHLEQSLHNLMQVIQQTTTEEE